MCIGDPFKPYMRELDPAQLKLVTIYIKRTMDAVANRER